MILLTPDEFKATVADAVKTGIELYKAQHEVEEAIQANAPVVVKDLAKERGYSRNFFLSIVNNNDIPRIKDCPVTIASKYLGYFPTKKIA